MNSSNKEPADVMSNKTSQHSRDGRDDSTMLSHDKASSHKHLPVRLSTHNTAAAESQVAMAEYGGMQAKAMPMTASSNAQHEDAGMPFLSAQANTQQRVSSSPTKDTTTGHGNTVETERPYYGLSSTFFKRQSVGRDGGDSPTLGHGFSSRFQAEGTGASMPTEHSHGPREPSDVNQNKSSQPGGSHEARAPDVSAAGVTSSSSSKKKKNKKKKKGQGQSMQSESDEGATSGSASGALGQQIHLVHSSGPHHAVMAHHTKPTHAGNGGVSDQGGMIGIGDQGGMIGIGEQGGMIGIGDQGGAGGGRDQDGMIGIGDQGGMIGIGDRDNHTMAAPAHSIHYAGTRSQHRAPLSRATPPELEKGLHFEASHATAFPSTKRDSADDRAHSHGQGHRDHTSSERLDEPVISIGELPRHERFSGPLEYLRDSPGDGTGTNTQGEHRQHGSHTTAAKVGAGLAGLGAAAAAAGQFESPMTHHDPSAIQKQDHAPQGSFFTQPDTYSHKAPSSSHAHDSRQSGQGAGTTYAPSAPPSQDHHSHPKVTHIETIHKPYHGQSSSTGPSQHSQTSKHIETIHQPYSGPEPGIGTNSDACGTTSAPGGSQTLNRRTTWLGFGVPVREKKVKPPGKARPLSFGYGYKDHAEAYRADWKERSKAELANESPVVANMALQPSGAEASPSAHSSSPSHDHTVPAQGDLHTTSMRKKGHYLTHSKSLGAKTPSSPRFMPGYIPANMRRSHLPPPQSPITTSSTTSAVGTPIVVPSSSLQIQSVTPQRQGVNKGPQIHSFSPSQDRPVHVEETWHTSNLPKGHYLMHSTSLNSKRQSTPREIPSFAPPSLRRSHVPTPPPQPSAANQMNSKTARAMTATGAAAVPLSLAAASSLARTSHHSTAAALPTPKTDVSLYDEEQGSYPRGEKDLHDNPVPSSHPTKVTELSVSSSSDHRLAPLVMAASMPAYDAAAEASALASSETSPIHNQLRRPSTAVMLKKPNADLSLYPEEEGAYSHREEDRHENPAPSEHPVGATEEIQLDEKDMHAHHDAHLTMADKVKDALGGLHVPSLSSKNSKKKKKKKAAAAAAVSATGAAGVAAALRSMTPEPDDTHDEGSISARKVEAASTTPSTILVTDKATKTHSTSTTAGSASAAATAAIAAGAAASHNRKNSRLLRKGSSGAGKAVDDDELAANSAGTHISKDSETAEAMIPASDFAIHSQGIHDKSTLVENDDDMEAAVIRAGDQAAMTVEGTSTKAIAFADETEGSTSQHPGDNAVIESTTTTAVIESTDEDVEDEDGKKKKVKKNKVPLKTRISKATSSSAAAVSSAASHSAAAVSTAASHSAAAVTAAAVSSAAAVTAAAVAYKERQPVVEKPTLLLTEDDVPQPSMPQVSHKLALTEDDVEKPVVPTVSHLLTLTEDDVEKPTVPVVSHKLTLTEDDVDKPTPNLSAPPVLQLTEDDVEKPDPSSASHPVVPKVPPKLVSTSMIKVTTAPRPVIPEQPVQGKDIKFPRVRMPVVVMPRMPRIKAPKMPHVSKPKMFKFSAPKMPHVRMPTLRKKSKVAPEVMNTSTVVETVPVAVATVAAVENPEPVRTFVVNPPVVATASSSTPVPTFTSKLVEPIGQVPVEPEPIKTFVVETPSVVQAAPQVAPVITSKLVEPRVEPPKTEWVQPAADYVPPPPQPAVAEIVEAPLAPQPSPAPTSDNGESVIWVKKTYTTQQYYDSEDEDELDEYGYRKDRDVSRYITPTRTSSGRYTNTDGPKTDRLNYSLRNHTRPAGYQGQPLQQQQVYNYQPDQKQEQQQHRLVGNNMGYSTQPRQSAF